MLVNNGSWWFRWGIFFAKIDDQKLQERCRKHSPTVSVPMFFGENFLRVWPSWPLPQGLSWRSMLPITWQANGQPIILMLVVPSIGDGGSYFWIQKKNEKNLMELLGLCWSYQIWKVDVWISLEKCRVGFLGCWAPKTINHYLLNPCPKHFWSVLVGGDLTILKTF